MAMNSVVLITGASTGFGRAASETLGRRGYTVFAAMRNIAGRNAAHCRALESLARREGLPIQVLEMDVTQETSVERAVGQMLDQTGRIDVAINNAGIFSLGLTEAYTVEEFHRLFDVNVYGAVRVNRAVLPAMRRQRRGLLIHVSSAAGRVVPPSVAVYCASKHALEAVADAYRFELSQLGIDSVLVEPGFHRTPILENIAGPADSARTADYGPMVEAAARVREVFENAGRDASVPGPEEVVEAFVRLIETPAGQRPFRTVPTTAIQGLLDPYNAMAMEMRQTVAQIFQASELLELRQATSAGM